MRLCKALYGTGKIVILDSGFCVLQGLIESRKVGVFASALIKKRRYWPKYVPGKEINEHFKDMEIGKCDSLKGELDGKPYNIFCMKEPDYVMKIMSMHGGLTVLKDQKDSTRTYTEDGEAKTTTCKYTIPFINHFLL